MKKLSTLYILLLLFISSKAQESLTGGRFSVQIRAVEGDLNNDGLVDHVFVMMDTISPEVPLLLQIFMAQPDETYKLEVSSNQIIDPQYPAELKGEHHGNTIPNFIIKNGNLQMECYEFGQTLHTFKYQNKHFELIHFWKTTWDGADRTTETNYNLQTGRYIEQYQLLGSDEIYTTMDEIKPVKILPRIQDFIPFENDLY